MRMVGVKFPWTRMESELEEGEIPEFDYLPSVSHREGMYYGSHRCHSLARLRAHEKCRREARRYDPLEGEYNPEEDRLCRRNRMLRNEIHKHLMSKTPKNLHSFQPTHGSVENIVTKVGESLNKDNHNCGKEKKTQEARYLVTMNDNRKMKAVLTEPSPIIKCFKNDYYKKRRHSEPNPEPVNTITGRHGKTKCRRLLEARRSGKDIDKKRKRGHDKVCDVSMDKTVKSQKFHYFEEREKERHGRKRRQRKCRLRRDKRFSSEVSWPESEESQETNDQQMQNLDNSNSLPDNPKDSPSDTVAESNFVDSPSTLHLDGDSALKYSEKSEVHRTISTEKSEPLNDEDDDDDIELIKLRLLALTSNKKKSTSSNNESHDNVKDSKVYTEENAVNDSKSDLVDDEKTKENPSHGSEETVKERRSDNEIDRYELFLRAEALKTALMKKHQRIVKKRKSLSDNSGKGQAGKSENSNENKKAKRKDIDSDFDIDIFSDEELFEDYQKSQSHSDTQLGVTKDDTNVKSNNVSKLNSKSVKESKETDVHQEVIDVHQKVTDVHQKVTDVHQEVTDVHQKVTDVHKKVTDFQKKVTDFQKKVADIHKKVADIHQKVTDAHQENELHTENLVTAESTGYSVKSSLSTDCVTLESNKALNNEEMNLKNVSTEEQLGKKKPKSIKPKQTKESTGLNEKNIIKSHISFEKKDDCQETKLGRSLFLNDKNNMEPKKKPILKDSLCTSNPEINITSTMFKSQPLQNGRRKHKSIINQKPLPILINEESVSKIPQAERIIVHLGSDSSDDEFIPDCLSDQKSNTVVNNESTDVNSTASVVGPDELREFEKSVELLLSGARRKIEKSKELKSEIPTAPEAVYSHLAPSQRLEYIRLKQKIAEKEEKLGKAEQNSAKVNAIEDKSISQINVQKNIRKKPLIGQNLTENKSLNFGNQLEKREIRNPCDQYSAIHTSNLGLLGNSEGIQADQSPNLKKPVPEPNLQKVASTTTVKDFADFNSRNTIKKGAAELTIERTKMLNQNRIHLERLKILWKNIKVEKMMEAKYEKEIKKLKTQQNFFEQKVNQQRLKIKKLADESQQIYEAFQKNTEKLEIIEKACKRKGSAPDSESSAKKMKESEKVATETVRANVKESKEFLKEIFPGRIGNDVRLIAQDIEIGVNEKGGDLKAKETVENERRFYLREAIAIKVEGSAIEKLQRTSLEKFEGTTFKKLQGTTVERLQDTAYRKLQEMTVERLQDTGFKKPQGTPVEKLQDTGFKKLQGTAVEKPQETSFKKLQGTAIEKPQDTGFKKLQGTAIEKPQETGFKKLQGTAIEKIQLTPLQKFESTAFGKLQGTPIEKLQETGFKKLQGTAIEKPQDTGFKKLQGTAIGKPQDTGFKKLQGTAIEKPQDTGFKKLQGTAIEKPQDTGFKKLQGTAIEKPQDTGFKKLQGTAIEKIQLTPLQKFESTAFGKLQGTAIEKPQDTAFGNLQGTAIEKPQDTAFGNLQGTAIEKPQDTAFGKLQGTAIEKPQDTGFQKLQGTAIEKPQETGFKKLQGTAAEKLQDTATDQDCLKEYNSPLQTLTKSTESSNYPRVDPNVTMCQYDLLGKCNDEECAFQHFRT